MGIARKRTPRERAESPLTTAAAAGGDGGDGEQVDDAAAVGKAARSVRAAPAAASGDGDDDDVGDATLYDSLVLPRKGMGTIQSQQYLPAFSATRAPRRHAASVFVVYLTAFLDICGFSILIPILPYYLPTLKFNHQYYGIYYGSLIAFFAFGSFIGNATTGILSDRVGRRKMLIIGLLGSGSAWLFTAFMRERIQLLIVARFVAGVFSGTSGLCSAYLCDVTSEKERPRFLGRLGAITGCGVILGPVIGIVLTGTIGAKRAFFIGCLLAASIMYSTFLLALLLFRDAKAALHESVAHGGAGGVTRINKNKFKALAKDRDIILLCLASLTFNFYFTSFETTMPVYVASELGLPVIYLFICFGGWGLLNVIISALYGRLLSCNCGGFGFSVKALALIGLTFGAVAIAVMPVIPSVVYVTCCISFISFATGLVPPSFSVMTSLNAKGAYGTVLGVRKAFVNISRGLGPLLAGAMYDIDTSKWFPGLPQRRLLPFFVGSFCAMLTFAIVGAIRRTEPAELDSDEEGHSVFNEDSGGGSSASGYTDDEEYGLGAFEEGRGVPPPPQPSERRVPGLRALEDEFGDDNYSDFDAGVDWTRASPSRRSAFAPRAASPQRHHHDNDSEDEQRELLSGFVDQEKFRSREYIAK